LELDNQIFVCLPIFQFQSIYAQSGRWNFIHRPHIITQLFKFQSIYAQSGRWTVPVLASNTVLFDVSIHLCPKWALECQFGQVLTLLGIGFNPSMPKVGVGIELFIQCLTIFIMFQSIYAQSGRWNLFTTSWPNPVIGFQSIYAQSGRWNENSFTLGR